MNEPKTVLIIEDDEPIAYLERNALEEAGYQVREVGTGADALRSLDAWTPDLIVLDYRLPDMTADDVLAALGDRAAALPIVIVTGYERSDLADRLLAAGANEFLTKDTRLEFLRRLPAVVAETIRRSAGSASLLLWVASATELIAAGTT